MTAAISFNVGDVVRLLAPSFLEPGPYTVIGRPHYADELASVVVATDDYIGMPIATTHVTERIGFEPERAIWLRARYAAQFPNFLKDEGGGGVKLTFPVPMKLDEIERTVTYATLAHFYGNKRDTAAALGISLKTLYNRLERYAGVPVSQGPHAARRPRAEAA